ncbi:hypothetical protein B0T17DRAFT_490372 [Bombardia bombarda]|uniref:Nucleotide exchange factor SIL1 n=1 Tax=Bombardia bombarda TaxID=252184 RepID=A0AA39X829_9PEZI|nr:hypothetical protein B0T17DRAFT_490372 [Bombardia bombarda]
MARLRMRSLPISLLGLIGVVLVGGVAATASADPSTPIPSPAADDDVQLICHTDNPAECYPKVFQATDAFQIVRDDQDIPPGLHVRLDVTTGLKQAKINVPDEAVDPSLEGLPTDTSIVILDQDQDQDQPQAAPKIPANAPAYDPVGKVKEPRQPNSKENNSFSKSLSILKKGLDVDEALEMLEDISHDIYYGLKIAEDYDTVKRLFCLANSPISPDNDNDNDNAAALSRAKLSALIIGSTVQNNPKALAEVEKHWPALQKEQCSPGSPEPLSTAIFSLTHPTTAADAALTKARVSAISGLLKNDAVRAHFLAHGGMEHLLQLLTDDATSSSAEWEPVRRKAGLLVLDNFLDENMGAALGEWPIGAQADDRECAAKPQEGTTDVTSECWDWHAKRLADRNYKTDRNHWSVELWNKIKEQRRVNNKGGTGERRLSCRGLFHFYLVK